MSELATLWETHRATDWPRFSSPHQGELMTLDTVITGCATYHLESQDGLDAQRRAMLETCVEELDTLLPEVPDEVRDYFKQLRRLASLLRERDQR